MAISPATRAWRALACSTALGVLAIGAFAIGAPWAQTPTAPIPFPSKYNWPVPSADLQAMIETRNTHALRAHSWYLWAGVNQPGNGDLPIWASWPTTTQVFMPPKAAPPTLQVAAPSTTPTETTSAEPVKTVAATRSVVSLAVINKRHRAPNPQIELKPPFYAIPGPIQQKYADVLAKEKITSSGSFPAGDLFQNNGDVLIVAEPFNQPSYDWIRGSRVYERATLDSLLAAGRKDIPELPATSIILKHMYWPVTKDGLTALPVSDMAKYDKAPRDANTYVGFENMERWSKAVAIDPSGARVGQTGSVTYLYDVLHYDDGSKVPRPQGPHTYPNAKIVGLSDFYYKKLSMAEFNAMSVYDRLIIDSAFYWAHGRLFEDGDYLVSVASHIITKEVAQWTLQSVWWQDDADTGPYAEDRPTIPGAVGPWRHYLMTTEDGVTTAPGGHMLPIAYNPYIELAAEHPVATNCRNCHIRAGTPGLQYLAPHGPGPLADFGFDNKLFQDQLRTDFLWTISGRAIPVPPN